MPIFRDFMSALRLAHRANYAGMAAGVIIVVVLASMLSAHFGGRQPATVALDIGFSIIRLLLPLLIVLLMQEFFSREFDKRYYLTSLTYPRNRQGLLLGRFAAVLLISWMLLLVLALVQVVLVSFISDFYSQATPVSFGQSYWIVIGFIALDLLILTALAALLAVLASTPSFVLIGAFGFMIVARSYATIIDLLTRDASLVGHAEGYRASLGVLGYLLPNLGALDVRELALYGKPEFLPVDWSWLLLSNFGYFIALLSLAVWALQRKRFA